MSEKMQHTPGPWIAHPGKGQWSGWLISPGVGTYTLAYSLWQHDADGNAHYNAEANAHLIAAAPELLEVLSNIVNNALLGPDVALQGKADCYHVPIDDIEAAWDIIIKARGDA